jgi:ribosome-associated protein YbcJ (S4-like RNA binding protein)
MIKAGWTIEGADSRRLVAQGVVKINGEVATEFNQQVMTGDTITLNKRAWTV